jgi:hypothetical protein
MFPALKHFLLSQLIDRQLAATLLVVMLFPAGMHNQRDLFVSRDLIQQILFIAG